MLVIARYEKPAQNGAAGVLTRCFGSRRCPHLRRPGGACPFHFRKALRALADGDVCNSDVLFVLCRRGRLPLQYSGSRRCPHLRRPEGACLSISVKPCGLWQTRTSATPISYAKGLVIARYEKPAQNGAAGVPTCEDPKGLVLSISVKPAQKRSRRCPHLRRPEGACPLHFCKALRALADGDVCNSIALCVLCRRGRLPLQ